MRLANRHLHDLADVQALVRPAARGADLHRERFGPEPVAVAGAAGAVVLVALELLAHPARIGLPVAAFHVRNDTLERAGDLVDPAALVEPEADFLVARAVEEHLLDMGLEVFPLRAELEPVVPGDRLDGLGEIGRRFLPPRRDGAVADREVLVGHDEPFVEEKLDPETVAVRAGPEGRVEGEQARLDLGNGEARDRAGEVFGERDAFWLTLGRRRLENGDAVGKVERGAETVGEPRLQSFPHHDPVDDDVDVVAELLVEHRRVVELVERPVDLHALEALFPKLEEFLAVFPLPVADDRGEKVAARALLHRHHPVDHVLHLLGLDRLAGGGRVGRAGAGEEKPHVIVDLGDRAHRRARVLRGGLLLDGNRRGETGNVVDVGLFHHVEELAGVGRQRFDVAALALGVDRVERQRGFPRARQPGDHDKLVARNVDVYGLQVVLARTADFDLLQLGHGVLVGRGKT